MKWIVGALGVFCGLAASSLFAQVPVNSPPKVVHVPGVTVESAQTRSGDVTNVQVPGVGVHSDTRNPLNEKTSVRVPGLRINVDNSGTTIGGPFGGTWIKTQRDPAQPRRLPMRRAMRRGG